MKIAITSDIHYPDPQRFYELIIFLRKQDPRILVIAGDAVSYGSIDLYHKFFRKLRRYYKGLIIGVAGNHEHWLTKNELRKRIYSEDKIKILSKIYRSYNAMLLNEEGPYCIKDICFTGSTGWYDYSYAANLGFSREDFENCNPWGCSINELLTYERGLYCNCYSWLRDCLYIRLRNSNEEYILKNIKLLSKQLDRIEEDTLTIVILHHVPRRELIKYTNDVYENFYYAYAGSNKIDEVIRKSNANIKLVVYGHIHEKSRDYDIVLENLRYMNGYKYTIIQV